MTSRVYVCKPIPALQRAVGIGSRLHTAGMQTHELEWRIVQLQTFVQDAVERYRRAESELARKAEVIDRNILELEHHVPPAGLAHIMTIFCMRYSFISIW